MLPHDSTRWIKFLQATTLALAVCFSMGATDAGSRFNDLGHRLMCTCGCAQLLGECNHVGCPESGRERNELTAAIAPASATPTFSLRFRPNTAQRYWLRPPRTGFDLVAWIAPFAVFAAALLGTILLVRHWSVGRTQATAARPAVRRWMRCESGCAAKRNQEDGGL